MSSTHLIDQYRMMHQAGHFPGHSIRQHLDSIVRLIRKTGAKTLLDYGCGKGEQYGYDGVHRHWGGMIPYLYDPAVPQYDEKPLCTFDGVICTDVLEHIPEDKVENVLRDIFGYASSFVFLSICTREAKKTLPDGRNCHLTIRPEVWWQTLIAGLEPAVMYEVEFTK